MDVPAVLVPPEVDGAEKEGEETGIEWWVRMYDEDVSLLYWLLRRRVLIWC